MSATVTKLPTSSTKAKAARPVSTPKAASAHAKRLARKARSAGYAFAGISAAGLALSLSHQAHGVAVTTSSDTWQSWAMAVEIDLALIAAKFTPYICSSEKQRDAIETYAKPLAYAALILCAWFNATGFAGYAPEGYAKALVCVILGIAVPGIIFALSQMAAILLLGKAK